MSGAGNVLSRAVHIIDLDDSRFHTGLRAVEANARQGAGRVQGILRNALAIGIGSSAFTSSIFAIRRGFEFAAEGVIVFNARLDQTTAAFTKLLGSQAEAEKQFAQLFEFAKRTPFNFDAVLKGATALQVFGASTGDAEGAIAGVGKSVLLTTENMKLFGDAAAATVDVTGSLENGFKQSTFWIGRMYQALQNNAPIGRAAMSLERLGLLLPEIRKQIELAASAGASGDEQFEIFKKSLERFNGLQEAQQESFFTQISTVQDNITRILAKIGRPAYEDLIGFLKRANDTLEGGRATSFVDDLTAGISRISRVGKSFLNDPATQKVAATFLRDAAQSLGHIVKLTESLVTTAKPFAAVLGLVANTVNEITKGFGLNAITLGTLIALAVKFRRALTIGADLATGKQLATDLVRDKKTGNLLTNSERVQFERERESELRDDVAKLRAREAAKLAILQRSRASETAAQDQVNKNVTRRAEMAQKAADTASKNAVILAQNVVDATKTEQSIAAKIAATQQQIVDAKTRQLYLEQEYNRAAGETLAKSQAIAANEQAQTAAIPPKSTRGDQLTLEKEARRRIEAQERLLAQTALELTTAKPQSNEEADLIKKRGEQMTELTRLQQQQVRIGDDALSRLIADQKKLQTEKVGLVRQENALLKDNEDIATRINRLQAIETEQVKQQLNATDAINRQQKRLTSGLAGQRLLSAKSAVVAGAGPTVQESVRLANASSVIADRERALLAVQRDRAKAEAELSRVTGNAINTFDKVSNVVGRVTQGLFILALAYGAVNIATGILFNDSLPGVIASMLKYGDTLGRARKEAKEFADAQRDNADGVKEFSKEINRQQEEIAKARAEVARLKQEQARAALSPVTPGLSAGDSGPINIVGKIRQIVGIGQEQVQNRNLAEANAKVAELERGLAEYNKRWAELNRNAAIYNGYLEGTVSLSQEDINVFEKMTQADPGFEEALKKLQEATEQQKRLLGSESLAPDVISRIAGDAQKFRDVGQVALKNFLRGFDTSQLVDFSELSDLATKIFESTGREGAVQEIAFGNLQVAIARAVDETQRLGNITSSTKAEIRGIAGNAGDEIIDLADAMGDLREATDRAAIATERFKNAQRDTEIAELALNSVIANGAKIYGEMEEAMKAAASQRAKGLAAAREIADGLREESDEAARSSRKRIEQLQDEQKVVQDAADAFDRAARVRAKDGETRIAQAQAEVDALDEQLATLTEAATNNANAFKAVMDGRAEQYARERGELSATEKQIIATYGAQLDGIRRVRDATRDRTDNLSKAQREQLLAFSEAINTALKNGDKAEASRLTRERSRFQQRSQRPIDLASERATVAQDRFDTAAKPIERAAEEQAIRDKQAITVSERNLETANLTLTTIQKDVERQAAIDDEERERFAEQIRVMGDGIDREERAAKAVADDFAESIRLQGIEIKRLEKADADQKERDDQRLANLKAINAIVEASYKDQATRFKAVEDAAKRVAELAEADVKKQEDIIERLKLQNGLLDTQVGVLNKILTALTGANTDVPNPAVEGPELGTAENPVPGPNTPGDISGPHAKPNPTGRLGRAPAGHHDEIVGGRYYWIPDGYEFDPSSTGNVRARTTTPAGGGSTTPADDTPTGDPSGPGLTSGLREDGGGIRSAGLRAGLGASGRFASAGVALPSVPTVTVSVPDVDPTAGGLHVNGPLIANATIREDADAELIGNQIVAGMVANFQKNSKRGFLRNLGGRG